MQTFAEKPLRFHWRLPQRGGFRAALATRRVAPEAALPDLDAQAAFCRHAEEAGIDALLVDIHHGKPDPMTLSLALAGLTRSVTFMVAYRPGLMSPTLFVQQVNTFAALSGGRIALNIVAGHSPEEQRGYGDHLAHDERYARMEEFLAICNAFWDADGPVTFDGTYYRIEAGRLNTPFVAPTATRPEIFIGGSSEQAQRAAARHAACWMRFADAPSALQPAVVPLRAEGTDVGLRLSVLARPTRAEAVEAARTLVGNIDARRTADEARFVKNSDAVSMRATYDLADEEWLTPHLWTGAVRRFGATTLALVGAYDDVADGLMAFKEAGIVQFILSGWPQTEEMIRFGREVLPRLRQREAAAIASPE